MEKQLQIPGTEIPPAPAEVLHAVEIDIDSAGRWTAYRREMGLNFAQAVRIASSSERTLGLPAVLCSAIARGDGVTLLVRSRDKTAIFHANARSL